MAVEVANKMPYNELSDIYSFSIIAYQILTGVAPFGGMTQDLFMSRVVICGERPSLDKDDYGRRVDAPPEIAQLLTQCWSADMNARPNAAEVSQRINGMLSAATGQRGGFSIFRFGK
jgi:serine/threonine protein kinase